MLAPEIKEIQRRYKGDRIKDQAGDSRALRERGVNPAAGCLPLLLQIILLIPMYSVFSQGLTNYDPQAMLNVFGVPARSTSTAPRRRSSTPPATSRTRASTRSPSASTGASRRSSSGTAGGIGPA